MRYVCSKKYKILCREDCYHAKNIKPENQVWFNSIKEGFEYGCRPCKHCRPTTFDDVIDNGRNIKMINITGCGIDENWTLDDCENNCPKYYSCYAVALANDILKEFDER